MKFPGFADRLAELRERMHAACVRAGREVDGVTLVAVTKGFDISAMQTAMAHGLTDLGENRVQDALPKLDVLGQTDVRVHLIGQLQTNKVNKAVGRFASIMSVDRHDLLDRIGRRASALGVEQSVWIQVNTSGEGQKAGCSPADAEGLVESATRTRSLNLRGLMTMGRAGADETELRKGFAELRQLRDRLVPGGGLSMGMSGDFEIAVEEGATHIRVGTTLFGPRPPRA